MHEQLQKTEMGCLDLRMSTSTGESKEHKEPNDKHLMKIKCMHPWRNTAVPTNFVVTKEKELLLQQSLLECTWHLAAPNLVLQF